MYRLASHLVGSSGRHRVGGSKRAAKSKLVLFNLAGEFRVETLVGHAGLRVPEGLDVADEELVVLKQGAVAGIGIEDQLSVAQNLEHRVGVVCWQHSVVAAANHEGGLGDSAQYGVLGIGRGAPGDQRLGLRIGHCTAAFGVPIFLAGIDSIQERVARGLAGSRLGEEERQPPRE
jgi:hypothetical protein